MSRKIQKFALPLLLVSILALFSLYGCTGQPGISGTSAAATSAVVMSAQQAEQILNDSMAGYKGLNTYKYNMAIDINLKATGGQYPGNALIKMLSEGGMNVAAKEMQMSVDMNVSGEGVQVSGDQTMSYKMYLLTDWLYMNLSGTGMQEQWTKTAATDEIQKSLNLEQVNIQTGILENPSKVECLYAEEVDGVDCYVMSVTPNDTEIETWLSDLSTNLGTTGFSAAKDFSNLIDKFSYLCYVAKDSNLLMKIAFNVDLEYTSAEAGGTTEFDIMNMVYTINMTLYDHNKGFTVTLPPEAAGAKEISDNPLLN